MEFIVHKKMLKKVKKKIKFKEKVDQSQSTRAWYIHKSISTSDKIDSSMQQLFTESNSDILLLLLLLFIIAH